MSDYSSQPEKEYEYQLERAYELADVLTSYIDAWRRGRTADRLRAAEALGGTAYPALRELLDQLASRSERTALRSQLQKDLRGN